MEHVARIAALTALLTLSGVTVQAAEFANGANLNGLNLNGANLNGANLNGANLNGANLNGTTTGRVFLGAHVSTLIAPDGATVTLD